jgi:hypothetical protein
VICCLLKNEDDGWQLAGAVVTGMHFPPVRAPGYPNAGVLSLRKPVNNTASQQAADQTPTYGQKNNYSLIKSKYHEPFLFTSTGQKTEG